MTEYFTTSSLATRCIAVEQSFEGCEVSYQHGKREKDNLHFFNDARCWRFPKAPHNAALEVPRVGDYGGDGKYSGFVCNITDRSICITIYKMRDEWSEFETMEYCISKENFIIEKRNNLPFPVWDKEKM